MARCHVVGLVLEEEAPLGLYSLKSLFYRLGNQDPEKLSDWVIAIEIARDKAEIGTQNF